MGEPVEEWLLAGKHHGLGLRDREPLRRLDLWKRLAPAAARRPLDLEAMAHDRGSVEILLEREAFDDLSTGLPEPPHWNERPLQRRAKLFLSFAQGRRLRAFAG